MFATLKDENQTNGRTNEQGHTQFMVGAIFRVVRATGNLTIFIWPERYKRRNH